MKKQSLFGLTPSKQESDMWLIPAPWDATVSYRQGCQQGPEIISQASAQLDLYHPIYKDVFDDGIYLLDENADIKANNDTCRKLAQSIIKKHDNGTALNEKDNNNQAIINKACAEVHDWVYQQTEDAIKQERLVGLIGGDHSTSLGIIKALSDYIDSFAVLQFDAHMDLRECYQGFTHSHASVMKHVLDIPDVSRLIQVGVRDYCEEELMVMKQSKGRVKTFFNRDIKKELFQGKTWESICKKIINNCPENVYISFDIDALSPEHCPSTGTPVPGGLNFDQIDFLLAQLVKAKKRIVGFDLVEVAGEKDSVDAIVGARVLGMLLGYYSEANRVES